MTGGQRNTIVALLAGTNGWTQGAALAATALQAEADTLQSVVNRGGTVTSGAVTIDAANVRTNTYGGHTTALGLRLQQAGCVASGDGGSVAFGLESVSSGGLGSFASGSLVVASGQSSTALGLLAHAPHTGSFAWSGIEEEYTATGLGTFNLNPVGGLAGFYIGETPLSTTLSGLATDGELAAAETRAGTNLQAKVTADIAAHAAVVAAAGTLGHVKVGDGLAIDGDGVLSAIGGSTASTWTERHLEAMRSSGSAIVTIGQIANTPYGVTGGSNTAYGCSVNLYAITPPDAAKTSLVTRLVYGSFSPDGRVIRVLYQSRLRDGASASVAYSDVTVMQGKAEHVWTQEVNQVGGYYVATMGDHANDTAENRALCGIFYKWQ